MVRLYRRQDLARRMLSKHGDAKLPDHGFGGPGTVAEKLARTAAQGGDPAILKMALGRVDWPRGDPRCGRALTADRAVAPPRIGSRHIPHLFQAASGAVRPAEYDTAVRGHAAARDRLTGGDGLFPRFTSGTSKRELPSGAYRIQRTGFGSGLGDGSTVGGFGRSFDPCLRLWDAGSGECLCVLEGHWSYVRSMCFSQSGEQLLSGAGDGVVRLWGVPSGKLLQVFESHTDGVYQAFSTRARLEFCQVAGTGRSDSGRSARHAA
jgi:hypothetical protein